MLIEEELNMDCVSESVKTRLNHELSEISAI